MNLNSESSAFYKLSEFSFVKYFYSFCCPNSMIDTIDESKDSEDIVNDPAEAVLRKYKPESNRNEDITLQAEPELEIETSGINLKDVNQSIEIKSEISVLDLFENINDIEMTRSEEKWAENYKRLKLSNFFG